MKSDDLTAQQADVFTARGSQMIRYLRRLRTRMQMRKFPKTDELMRAVRDAHNAPDHVNVHLHYLSVESGVGRPERKSKPH